MRYVKITYTYVIIIIIRAVCTQVTCLHKIMWLETLHQYAGTLLENFRNFFDLIFMKGGFPIFRWLVFTDICWVILFYSNHVIFNLLDTAGKLSKMFEFIFTAGQIFK